MEKLPISVLARRFGNPGRRIWYMCQGADPEPIIRSISEPKSMGHGKVMPPDTRDVNLILTYLLHMSEKLGARLRRHDLQAQHYFIGLRNYTLGWLGGKAQLIQPSNDGQSIYLLARDVLRQRWQGQGISQVQITALDPKPYAIQGDFFLGQSAQVSRQEVNQALDLVNQRFGEFTLMPARLLNRSSMPNVIAPAWKPDGHRETIG